MAPLAARAPPLTLRRAAGAVGRGVELRDGADVARRGQRKAAGARSVTVPLAASQLRADATPTHSQRFRRVTLLYVRRPATARRASRAFKDVWKVLTGWDVRDVSDESDSYRRSAAAPVPSEV